MMACPFTVVDSMRWMLSTVVVSTRSYEVVIRPSSSSVFSPLYCQATAMTGMLIAGKMSVGVRMITTGLTIRIRSARRTKVYGRSRATRTIHMGDGALEHATAQPLRQGARYTSRPSEDRQDRRQAVSDESAQTDRCDGALDEHDVRGGFPARRAP